MNNLLPSTTTERAFLPLYGLRRGTISLRKKVSKNNAIESLAWIEYSDAEVSIVSNSRYYCNTLAIFSCPYHLSPLPFL